MTDWVETKEIARCKVIHVVATGGQEWGILLMHDLLAEEKYCVLFRDESLVNWLHQLLIYKERSRFWMPVQLQVEEAAHSGISISNDRSGNSLDL